MSAGKTYACVWGGCNGTRLGDGPCDRCGARPIVTERPPAPARSVLFARVEIVVEPSPFAKVPQPTAHVLGLSEQMGTAVAHRIAWEFLRRMEPGVSWCAYPQVRPCSVMIETADGTDVQAKRAAEALREAAVVACVHDVTVEWRMPATATEVQG